MAIETITEGIYPFFKLPAELRLAIYDAVALSTRCRHFCYFKTQVEAHPTNLLLVSRRFSEELREHTIPRTCLTITKIGKTDLLSGISKKCISSHDLTSHSDDYLCELCPLPLQLPKEAFQVARLEVKVVAWFDAHLEWNEPLFKALSRRMKYLEKSRLRLNVNSCRGHTDLMGGNMSFEQKLSENVWPSFSLFEEVEVHDTELDADLGGTVWRFDVHNLYLKLARSKDGVGKIFLRAGEGRMREMDQWREI